MRFVPIKTDDQLDLQAIHRVRDRLVSRRTAVINQIRAFRLERGMVFAQKPAKLRAAMADVLENADNALTPMMRNLIGILGGEWKTVEQQIEELTDRLEQIASSCSVSQAAGRRFPFLHLPLYCAQTRLQERRRNSCRTPAVSEAVRQLSKRLVHF